LGTELYRNCRITKNHPEQSQRVSAKDWGIELRRIYGAPCRGILPRMTRHKHAHIGLGTPSPLDRWIDAMLRVLAMLVPNVVSTLQMFCRRQTVNATQPTPTDLPKAKTDTQSQKANNAARQSSPTPPSVSHAARAIHLPQSSIGGGNQRIVATKGNLPPPVRRTKGCGLRALARKTEGAALHALTPNKNAAA
jgi:hypothetical protein